MSAHEDWTLVSAYADGALDAEEQALFEEHLGHCSECRCELAELRSVKAQLAGSPRHSAPLALRRTLEKQYGKPTLWHHFWSGRWPRWVVAGVAGVAVLTIGLAWWSRGRTSEPATMALEPLLAAHSEFAGERPLPAGDYFNATSSVHLANYEENSLDD